MIKLAKFGKWEIRKFDQDQISCITNEVASFDKSYSLDLNNTAPSLFEKFVFELARHQLQAFDPSLNINDVFVEFSNTHRAKIQDEHYTQDNDRINPLVCSYTFFNNSIIPLLITNLDFEKYKYKEFTDEIDFIMAFPNKLDHISFDGKLYHGFCPVFGKHSDDLITLKINIFEKPVGNMSFYAPSSHLDASVHLQLDLKEQLYHAELVLDTSRINRKFMENIVYNKTPEYVDLTDLFSRHEENIVFEMNHFKPKPNEMTPDLPVEIILFEYNNLFIISSQKTPLRQTKFFLQLIEKHGYAMYDVLDCYKHTISNTNRFYKERKLDGFFSDSVCNWIVGEMVAFNKSASALNVEQIPHLFRFVMHYFSKIIEFVTNTYGLIDMNINITQIKLIKDANTNAYSDYKNHMLKVVIPLVKCEKYNAGDLIISSLNLPEESSGELNTRIVFYLDFVYE